MKGILILTLNMLFLSVFNSNITIAQFPGYEIVFDTEGRSGFGDSKQDIDGNIILCGGERDLPYFDKIHAIVVKVSPLGDTLIRTFNYEGDTMCALGKLVIVPDGNYLFFGAIGKQDSVYDFKEMKNLWVLKLDENLNVIWDKRFEVAGDYWNPAYEVWQSSQNIYIAGKVDWWDGYYRNNFFMAKFDLNGDTIKTSYPFIDDPMQFPLGGITGGVMGRPSGQEGMIAIGNDFVVTDDYGIIEIDSNLAYTFTPLTYPGNYSLSTTSIKRFTENSYLWASSVHIAYQGNMDILVAKLNNNHQFTDHVIYGRTDTADYPAQGRSIDFVDPNNIFVASKNNHFSSDPIDLKVSISLLDSSLNLKGWKWFGGDMNYYISNITVTQDGGCVIAGTVCDWQNNETGDVDLWVKKIYPVDIITNAEDTPDPNDSDFIVFPNPGKNFLALKTARENLMLKLFGNSGKLVLIDDIIDLPTHKVNTRSVAKGNYLYQVWDKKKGIMIGSGNWIKN